LFLTPSVSSPIVLSPLKGGDSALREQEGQLKPTDLQKNMTPGPAAALGGVAGLAVLGPLAAVAGAGAAAYAATRDDKDVSSGAGMVKTAGASRTVAADAECIILGNG
jgi:hypothetical protein